MNIVQLKAENFKRLKAVEIHPDGNTVVIAGRNAQGKSSVLDAIQAALAGRAGAKTLERPIRDGEKRATVEITLDDLKVTRKWTPGGTELVVSPRDGSAKLNSPQKVLDALIGSLSFDPLAFAMAKPADQREMLVDLIGARERFDEIAAYRQEAYEERTVVNRQAKTARAKLENLPTLAGAGDTKVDTSQILRDLEASQTKQGLRDRWTRLEHERARIVREMAEVSAEAQAIPEVAPYDVLRAALLDAEVHNQQVDEYLKRQELADEADKVEARAKELTEAIEHFDREKVEAIANRALPVPGLGVDDDGVTLNGLPLSAASQAEKIRLSVAMAMASNPDLKVICIRDASLLDADSFRLIAEMAEANGFQVWYERVGQDAGGVGVVIEDGMVQS